MKRNIRFPVSSAAWCEVHLSPPTPSTASSPLAVLFPVLCYHYLLTILVFTICVADYSDNESWDNYDAPGPRPPIPELIQIENEIAKEKVDQSKEVSAGGQAD